MKILWMSDFDLSGSGYANISVPVCSGLVEKGHELKAIGLGYKNEEHAFPFQLLPAMNIKEASAEILNLQKVWGAEIVVVALDVPIQERIINAPYLREREVKYAGLFPIEADPLCFSWAMVLMQMDKCMVISEFGVEEAKKSGVEADYIQVGLDSDSWPQIDAEQKSKLRGSFGFDDDTFVVLTVADNQERKNLVTAMDMFAEFSKDKENVHYILVTREHNLVGWKLRDYAKEIGISEKLMIFERGMSQRDLWVAYAVSNVFLLTSKAEGLGMPLLEAMSVGVPCVATDCTGMKELLSDDRGFLLPYQFTHRDPFGNGRRYWVSKEHGVNSITNIYEQRAETEKIIDVARKYVEGRTWDVAVDQVEKALLETVE
jgi:glycosyltransferase involved in cell wall biosynthesis